jgi:hypothetical protein
MAFAAAPDAQASETATKATFRLRYQPVANAQIAIWVEDEKGTFLADLFLTQATGRLGIGNRPGLWNFLSSWRAPYGPRPSVLPIWAHRRNKTFPRIIFHDPNSVDSLGFHEATSSRETYHCRPFTPQENENVIDAMTCPSPQAFKSDKGRFDLDGATSVYPPRNDIAEFDEAKDHEDTLQYSELNDLDAISGATPNGQQVESLTAVLPAEVMAKAQGKLVFWLEISLENDQNDAYTYNREDDHFVDPRLAAYGVPYLGQPSVVYTVPFELEGTTRNASVSYSGYGDWNGESGNVHDPDTSISDELGTGAGRLRDLEIENLKGRFFVERIGASDEDPNTTDPDSTEDTEGDDCEDRQLPPFEEITAEPTAFDRVELTFRVPDSIESVTPTKVRVFYQTQFEASELDPSQAIEYANVPPPCAEALRSPCLELRAGATLSIEVDQLWGNYNYAFAVTYDDVCGQQASYSSTRALTPKQAFQQLESFCVVATASYGAPWTREVAALRTFRDHVLRPSPVGRDLVGFYYNYGPALARLIAPSELARAEVRAWLSPFAQAAIQGLWTRASSAENATATHP